MTVHVSNVSIRRGEQLILESVSFEAKPGQFTAIAGVNGSGKSSLLGAVSGQFAIEQGKIEIDGRRLESWSLKALARRRAVLPQDSDLSFPFRVLDVVLMGRSAYNEGIETARDLEITEAALCRVGLDSFAERRYTELSGGERQRVHLARVLAQVWPETSPRLEHEPTRYLFLDEPTASQDLAAQHRVLKSARDFADDGGVVIAVLHDLNQVAQYADQVLLLS